MKNNQSALCFIKHLQEHACTLEGRYLYSNKERHLHRIEVIWTSSTLGSRQLTFSLNPDDNFKSAKLVEESSIWSIHHPEIMHEIQIFVANIMNNRNLKDRYKIH